MPNVNIRLLDNEVQLNLLEQLWISLHRHHRLVVSQEILVADDSLSWRRRHLTYAGWLAGGNAIVLLAERDGAAVGYAVAHLVDGPDDTYAVGDRYADLYSLSVAPHVRGAGIGTELLNELDRRLDEVGITDLKVTVMSANVDAIRFYERRGLIPVETRCWRINPRRR